MKQKILYLITGHSGAGKTTRAKELMKQKGIRHHYEADMLMIDRNGDYAFNPRKLKECHNWCQKATERAMLLGEAVIVSNTMTMKWEAKPYIDMARYHNYHVIIEHLNGEYKNIHDVPQEIVEKMKNRRDFFQIEDFEQ
jgi:tRNA uridine 5-carbamoylmethylation protein Kti12